MATCPKCRSTNVSFQMVQTSAVTTTKKRGCLFSLGRLFLICVTCGLWLVFGRKKEKSRTTYSHTKVAICQNCGYQWNA